MLVDTKNLLAISEASSRGLSKLASEAERGNDSILLRNSKPVAAVVGMARLERLDALEAIEEDLELMALTLVRVVTDSGNRTSLDDVLAHFGLNRDDLGPSSAEESGSTG